MINEFLTGNNNLNTSVTEDCDYKESLYNKYTEDSLVKKVLEHKVTNDYIDITKSIIN